MTNQLIIYAVSAESQEDAVKRITASLQTDGLLPQAEIKFVQPADFEKTDCFKEARKRPNLIATYYRLRDHKEIGNSSITTELIEQGVLLFERTIEPRGVLHEYLHCLAVRSNPGIELRSEYSRVAPQLDVSIGKESRQLAEVIILLPEDASIEKQIVAYAAEDERKLGVSAEGYVKNMFDTFTSHLKVVQEREGDSSYKIREQTGMHRLSGCFKSVSFSEIASGIQSAQLSADFIELSKGFRASIDLVGVDINGLWNLTKRPTIRPWVDECASTLTRIARSARMR
ncbi:MAG: hypothetical protein ABSD99_06285 [Candidatus Bathyarchaeia archaeon]|jgi:hypothetical protein